MLDRGSLVADWLRKKDKLPELLRNNRNHLVMRGGGLVLFERSYFPCAKAEREKTCGKIQCDNRVVFDCH